MDFITTKIAERWFGATSRVDAAPKSAASVSDESRKFDQFIVCSSHKPPPRGQNQEAFSRMPPAYSSASQQSSQPALEKKLPTPHRPTFTFNEFAALEELALHRAEAKALEADKKASVNLTFSITKLNASDDTYEGGRGTRFTKLLEMSQKLILIMESRGWCLDKSTSDQIVEAWLSCARFTLKPETLSLINAELLDDLDSTKGLFYDTSGDNYGIGNYACFSLKNALQCVHDLSFVSSALKDELRLLVTTGIRQTARWAAERGDLSELKRLAALDVDLIFPEVPLKSTEARRLRLSAFKNICSDN